MFYPKRKRIMWVAYVMNLIVFTQLLIAVSNAVDHVIMLLYLEITTEHFHMLLPLENLARFSDLTIFLA